MILVPRMVCGVQFVNTSIPLPMNVPTIFKDTPAASKSLSLDTTSTSLIGELLNFS